MHNFKKKYFKKLYCR